MSRPTDDRRVFRDGLLDHKDFLRFGAFGRGPSRVLLDEEFRREVLGGKNYESGLSVYEAERLSGGRVRLVVPDRGRSKYHRSGNYMAEMLDGFTKSIARDDVFLVTGKVVQIEAIGLVDDYGDVFDSIDADTGSDGEPLLVPSSVRIRRRFRDWSALDMILLGDRPIGDVKLWYGRTLRDAVERYEIEEERERVPRRGRTPRLRTMGRSAPIRKSAPRTVRAARKKR